MKVHGLSNSRGLRVYATSRHDGNDMLCISHPDWNFPGVYLTTDEAAGLARRLADLAECLESVNNEFAQPSALVGA